MSATAPALELTPSGDVVFPTRWVSERSAAVVQKSTVRLKTFVGEYVLDRFKGIDWLTLRDGKLTESRLQTIRSVIVAEIEDLDGVKVLSSSVVQDGRSVSVSVTAVIETAGDEAETVTAIFGLGGGVADPLSLRRLILGGARGA